MKDFKEDYFGDIVGVTRLESDDKTSLVLRFFFNTGDEKKDNAARRDYYYLKTKPFYPYISFSSEEFITQHGYADATMDIIPNKELEWMLLRYADTAKIICEGEFRDRMMKRIQNIVNKQGE